ncbi:hypothetical protein K488DRAFT_14588, partial [Vararia minispora EC-137]
IKARHDTLASLPIPDDIPDEELKPIVLPSNISLQDFLRSILSAYEILQEATTHWCPEREEHGYFLTPLFKCITNPRVSTAHCWSMADVTAKMTQPTGPVECFYTRGGKWYYAGVYQAIRLADLAPVEWEQLTPEVRYPSFFEDLSYFRGQASQALIKDTITGRKNVSPQNIYEVTQLYVAGALRVACVGIQCIGFNEALYKAVIDHANFCTQAARGPWR